MDIKEFRPAFMELISPNLTKKEIQDGVNVFNFFNIYVFSKLIDF